MGFENEKHLMVSTQLLKIIGLYQLLSPHGPKFYNLNIFRCIAVVQISIFFIIMFWHMINICYYNCDFHQVVQYIGFLVAGATSILKIYYMVRYSSNIWNCIQLTSIHVLYYKKHNRPTLEIGQTKSKSFSIIFMCLWFGIIAFWLMSPFVINDYYINIYKENINYYYRFNVLNFIFSVNDKFYNEHFLVYYFIESFIMIIWGHWALCFDIILISMCITISYQLRTIFESYSTFGFVHDQLTDNKTETVEYDETIRIRDFKILIIDQQIVIENMRNIYRIYRPAILLQILSDSLCLLLSSGIIIMNYLNGMPFLSTTNIRILMILSLYTLHVFITCALFSDVGNQRESMNFAMYSSNWTGMSLSFKKLLLLAMRMNSAEQLNLQFTRNRNVNFEMFTNIMRTTYSMLSVLANKYQK